MFPNVGEGISSPSCEGNRKAGSGAKRLRWFAERSRKTSGALLRAYGSAGFLLQKKCLTECLISHDVIQNLVNTVLVAQEILVGVDFEKKRRLLFRFVIFNNVASPFSAIIIVNEQA